MKYEVITAITMKKIFVYWDIISCGLVYMNRLHGIINLTVLRTCEKGLEVAAMLLEVFFFYWKEH